MRLAVDLNMKAFPRIRTRIDALLLSEADFQGPILTRLGQLHRDQEQRIFGSEGGVGAQGPWPPLSPAYAAYKKRKVGRRKILVWNGDMKERFIQPSRPEYIQRFIPTGRAAGLFEFGAASVLAGYHFAGAASTRRSRPKKGRGKTYRVVLPRRDMVTKSPAQILELQKEFIAWYRNERIPQALGVASPTGKGAR